MKKHPFMTPFRLMLLVCALLLLRPDGSPVHSDTCHRHLMRHADLRQFYARGDGMGLRIAFEPKRFSGLRPFQVKRVAVGKLRESRLYEPDVERYRFELDEFIALYQCAQRACGEET